jgi:hypothetical protein
MSNKIIEIPHSLLGHTMKENTDSISFTVTADCTFCYSDPTPCFPSFMAAKTYTATTPPTTYGPYTPNKTGTVLCGTSIPPAACSYTGDKETACSITVDS